MSTQTKKIQAILKMLKEAKRRISIDREIVEVCQEQLETFYGNQEVEHIIEEPDVIFRRVSTNFWKYPDTIKDEIRLIKEKAQLNGIAEQAQNTTWRMVEVQANPDDDDVF